MTINIAIDGPSGAGKSSISNILADKLGYVHLDTGAMYRSVAYFALKKNIALDDEDKVVEMIHNLDLNMKNDGTIICDGEDITKKIREPHMSMAASNVSKLKNVRAALVKMQQKIAANKGYILDGRDIGTVVLTDAEVKIFLTASAEERAKRRVLQNEKNGIKTDYKTIYDEIIARDYQDSHRENSPLKKADDAIEIDSSNMTIDEVVNEVLKYANNK